MAKKYTGNFAADAAKALKKAERLSCQVTERGIFVTNGNFAWKMEAFEYAAIVQPVSCCEPGNWSMDKTGKRESSFDIEGVFNDAVKSVADAVPLKPCPLCVSDAKIGFMSSYYSDAGDFAAFYNQVYIQALAACTLKSTKSLGTAVAFCGDYPYAIVLPIRAPDEAARAVKAYHTTGDNAKHNAEPEHNAEADELRKLVTIRNDELLQARDQLAEQAAELAAMRDQLAAMQAAPVEQKPEPKTSAEIIAARFAELPGVTATVKGAQTAAPVVWLAGDTEHNADAIKAAGAKWSSKKAAFYYRVA